MSDLNEWERAKLIGTVHDLRAENARLRKLLQKARPHVQAHKKLWASPKKQAQLNEILESIDAELNRNAELPALTPNEAPAAGSEPSGR